MVYLRSRRKFLQLSGVTAASALTAGCTMFESEEDGIVLGDILVRNAHPNAHTVRVELERDDELIPEVTVEVDGDSAVERIAAEWPSTPAVYTLQYVVFGPDEEPDIRTRTLTAEDEYRNGYDCHIAAITIGLDDSPPQVMVGNPKNMSSGTCPD